MGGYVAQEIMRKAPEREERLALIDTNARARYGGPSEHQARADSHLSAGQI